MKKNLGVTYLDSKNKVHFGLNGRAPNLKRGIQALLQNVIIRLFTQFNSNAYIEEIGSNLYNVIHGSFSPEKKDELKTVFTLIFDSVQEQIIEEQETKSELVDTEKLKKLELKSIVYNARESAWELGVSLTTMANTAITFTV